MQINESEKQGITVLTLSGRVDNSGAVLLGQAVESALDGGQHRFVFDMSNLRYINSQGLRVLANALKRTQQHNGNVFLVKPLIERNIK